MNQFWYHGTTSSIWRRIQKDGMLWGKSAGSKTRGTALTRDMDEASAYGDVLLRVEYAPLLGRDDYQAGRTSFRVHSAIPLWDVTLWDILPLEQDEISGMHKIPVDG
jgi:hypothetical protein